jgi:hypothetical protein
MACDIRAIRRRNRTGDTVKVDYGPFACAILCDIFRAIFGTCSQGRRIQQSPCEKIGTISQAKPNNSH